MKTATLDERRRLVMPPECPPHAAVTIQQVDEDTWLVKRAREQKNFRRVLIPIVMSLPDDPEWDKVEAAFAGSAYKKLKQSPPED